MFKFLKTAALSVVLGTAVLGVVPASAQTGIYLGLGGGQPRIGIIEEGNSYRRHDRRDDRRYDRRDDRRYERRAERGCSTGQALNKAERMGLRRARIVDAGRRSIEVSGRVRGDRVIVSFGRAPGCPVWR